jgi:hypothetical protein
MMKYIIALYLFCAPFYLLAQANTVDIGIFNVPAGSNTFEVRIKPIQTITGQFSAGVFTVRYPASYGVTMGVLSSIYGYAVQDSGIMDGNKYYSISFASVYNGQTWPANVERVIAILNHSNTGTGIGMFEISPSTDPWTANNGGSYYMEVNLGDAQRMIYGGPASSPLPVELINFSAKALPDHTVALDWRTYAENRIENYFVEHSTDGLKFDPIGRNAAKGGLNAYADYNLIDKNPVTGINYYRLKMVNFEGTYAYSPVRTVTFNDEEGYFKLLPNPTQGPFRLLFTSDKEDEARISITDTDGRLVKEAVLPVAKGANTFAFDDLNLSAGSYTVTMKLTSGIAQVQQLVVVKA